MPKSIPLIMVAEGKTCKIDYINAGHGLLRRLTEMGFTENAKIKILSSERGGLIIFLNNSKYALSKGISMKIFVSEL